MKGESVVFSHKSDDWETPDNLFKELNKEFDFDADMAANYINYKHANYRNDSLKISWHEENIKTVFINPPYKLCKDFVRKAFDESKLGITSVMLLPARTCTRWFHDYIYKNPNAEIRFLKGRLKFSNSKNAAPFPSMIVIFRG